MTVGLAVGVNAPRGGSKAAYLFGFDGQSNDVGKAEVKDNTNTPGIGDQYANVLIRRYVSGANSPLPLVWDDFPAQALAPRDHYLQAVNTTGNHGPELTFGRTLDALGKYSVRIVQTGVFNSDLAGQHNPDSTSSQSANEANLFTTTVQKLREAERIFNAPLAGYVWIQGEADATVLASANAYQANLTYYINRLRDVWPGLPIVIVKLNVNSSGANTAVVRAQQDAYIATNPPNVAYVNADDLALQGDNLHYTSDSYATLGTRIANAMAGLALNTTPTTPANGKWSVDVASGKPKPMGPWEWANLIRAAGVTAVAYPMPVYALRCDDRDASTGGDGNLHDTVGGMMLTGTALTKQTAVAGYTAKAVAFAGTTSAATTPAVKAFNVNTQSVCRFSKVRITGAPAAERAFKYLTNAANPVAVNIDTTGKLKIYGNGATVLSVNSHCTGASLWIVERWNRTAATWTVLTSLEKVVAGYLATTGDGQKGFGAAFGFQNHTGLILQDDFTLTGASAELTDAQVKSILTQLGEAIPW